MSYSQQFKDFILDLQQWVEKDFVNKENQNFSVFDSVCFQVNNWTENEDIQNILRFDLEEAFEGRNVPFNKEGDTYGYEKFGEDFTSHKGTYHFEMESIGHYKNPLRLAWIKNIADEFKKEIKS